MRRPATCTQPHCLLRDEAQTTEIAADWIVRLLSGETVDGKSELEPAQRIEARPACYPCALDVLRQMGPLLTEEEWTTREGGRRAHRRERRERKRSARTPAAG